MHHNEAERLRKHIAGTLQQCAFANTWPVFKSYTKHVQSLATKVVKHKKQWLTVSDVYSIFIDHVYQAVLSHKPEDGQVNGLLPEILGEDEFNALVLRLLSYFEGIPRKYSIYMPVPSLPPLLETVQMTDVFRLERVTSRKAFPGNARPWGLLGLFGDKIEPPLYCLVFEVSGYCGRNFSSSAARRALSTFKIAMQQVVARGLFKLRTNTPAGLGLLSTWAAYNVPKHFLVAVDHEPSASPTENLELPIEICRFLESHEFAGENGQVATAVASGALPRLLSTYLNFAAKLNATENQDAARVKTASEWAFDAYLNDNPTLSFLQTCIALEALYGDDSDGDNLTKTLADRCAYLIGSDIKGRRTIRENFRALYSVRSKIVHGCVGALAADEERYLDWGKSILEDSIFKEIKHLALEKA
jgi:hypothetical protein